MNHPYSRRQFIGMGATAATAAMLLNCSKQDSRGRQMSPLPDQAPDGPVLKAGVIGCGGRGSGAALDFLDAGPNLTVSAIGDVFEDRIEQCAAKLKERKGIEIPSPNRFVGFDAYQKVIASDVDIVILATPPHFRPVHFAAAIDAKKHVFMEKPVAVDPTGIRSIMSAARRANALGLNVVCGTQRRHSRSYLETFHRIADGAIGRVISANCYWNQSQLWYRTRQKGWSEMEFMLRDWVNWCWLSGDHIVEQHIHNIDVINWFTGKHPIKAVGFGGRHRRVTGDQFDFFSVDYTYEDGMHLHSMCRQINGTTQNVSEWIVGTRGVSNCRDTIMNLNGEIIWQYLYPKDESGNPIQRDPVSPYVQEHIDLVSAIRRHKAVNEAETVAVSNLVAIMGRASAYTGAEKSWDEMMNSDLVLGPRTYSFGPVDTDRSIPVPGTV